MQLNEKKISISYYVYSFLKFMKNLSRKYHGFTLIELVLAITIIGLLLPSIFALYGFIIRSNKEIVARQTAIQQWYEFFERLNIWMDDYTVDYEEYFNRQMVGCWWWTGANFTWNIWSGWYCTEFTAYGNENHTTKTIWGNDSRNYHDIYYCTSEQGKTSKSSRWDMVVNKDNCGRVGGRQSFWQYAALFKDVHGWEWIVVWTEDDEELWKLFNESVEAITDAEKIQELYLISHDGKSRLYFRRKNVAPEWEEPHYKIQMLRLRWFDAWLKHSFEETSNNEWLYDGVIDTWACDASMWFEPKQSHKTLSNTVWWAYGEYYLPTDENDCWIDLTQWSTNIFAWNISISPLWDADLYWADTAHQINTYMKIMTVNGVYAPALFGDAAISTIKDFKVPLETTINMRDFYRWYSE